MNYTLNLSLSEILITYGIITCLIISIIIGYKYILKRKGLIISSKKTLQKFVNRNRTKYAFFDIFRFRMLFLKTGLLVSLAFVFFAFQWTSFEQGVYIPEGILDIDDIEIEMPRTMDPPPIKPPPPPPPEILEVPEDEIPEDQPDFIDESIEEEFVNEEPIKEEMKPDPKPVMAPPPPPEEEVEIEEIMVFAEQMPRFPGCEGLDGDHKSKHKCAEQKMLEFIYRHVRYPAIASQNNVEGRCVAQFVIDKSGMVTNIKVLRDPGAGLGEASENVLLKMNDMGMRWTPGKQNGKAVKVMYTIPIMFRLDK